MPYLISAMALKTFVKLNSITNLTDARFGSGMYVDLLGFNLDKSSQKYISPDLFKEITGWVSGVEFVGELSQKSNPELLEILKEYPAITWIECDQIEALKSLAGTGYSLIYRIAANELEQIKSEEAELFTEAGILIHITSENDVLTESELEVVKNLAATGKVILGTGITEKNVLELLDNSGIFGISLTGGEELKPGLTELDQLADILEKLEIED